MSLPPGDTHPRRVEQRLQAAYRTNGPVAKSATQSPEGDRPDPTSIPGEALFELSASDRTRVPVTLVTWDWGAPYDEAYLTAEVAATATPKPYDFVAFFDGEPTNPFEWVDDHYYWMGELRTRPTLVSPTTEDVSHFAYVGFSAGRYHILQSGPVESSEETVDHSDARGVATAPHPDIPPEKIRETRENGHESLRTASETHHDVWAVDFSSKTALVWSNPTSADKWAWVGLYDDNPEVIGKDEYTTWAYAYDWVGNVRRSYVTGYDFGMGSDGYWAGFVDGDGSLLASSAPMRTRPDWMSSLADDIRDQRIRDLFIPGTHDSGTYEPVSPVGESWIQTQDESFEDQLVDGIRMLDLRIGYYPESEEEYDEAFWLVHSSWSTWVKLEELLETVAIFLDSHGDELIFLNFHKFQRFDAGDESVHQVHEKLAGRIMDQSLPDGRTLSDVMAPASLGSDVTPGQMWERDDNLIVTYSRQQSARKIVDEYEKLWLEVAGDHPHDMNPGWPNTNEPDTMVEWCSAQIEDIDHDDFWNLGSILTPQPPSYWSVRSLSHLGNPYITNKLATGWADKVNRVPVDFYRSIPHVEMAIEANRK